MGEHTPGPWVAVGAGVYTESDDPCLEIIFSAHNTRSASRETAKANARLIAAAPEMLEALKKILFLTNNATRDDIALVARAAIAKVEGE